MAGTILQDAGHFIGLQIFAEVLLLAVAISRNYRSDLRDGFGSFKEGLDTMRNCYTGNDTE